MRTIRGRKALVTGAASGIGRAIALALAAEGADLFLVDRDAEGLAGVAEDAASEGVEVLVAACDLAVPAEIAAMLGRVLATWRTVHILVNCAGIDCYGPLHLTTEAAWRRAVAVNLMAPIDIVHRLLPTLIEADQAHILNVCSFMGLVPVRRLPVYQVTKYGLVGFTLALRSDYHRENFGVTALCPGFVRTPMLGRAKDPEAHRPVPRLPAFMTTTAEAVAAKALAAIRKDRGLVVVTPFARLMWWTARLSPALVDWMNREGWRRRGKVVLPARDRSSLLAPQEAAGASAAADRSSAVEITRK
jgi:3-oxoacyl-[acyl-carrier protein] reductase